MIDMADLNETQVRQLFRAMHKKGSPTKNLVETPRENSTPPLDGDGDLAGFRTMFGENLEISEFTTDITSKTELSGNKV